MAIIRFIRRSLFLLALLTTIETTAVAQLDPQFKFYLAFEDAKGEKDTVWFVLDSTAHYIGEKDTAFGEVPKAMDSTKFNVGFYYSPNDYTGVFATELFSTGTQEFIYGFNHEFPVTIRWDTSLLHQHQLPDTIEYAAVRSYQYTDEWYDAIQLLDTNAGVFDSIFRGGGWADHFPMKLILSYDPYDAGGIASENSNALSVYPNPSEGFVSIRANWPVEVQLFNLNGQCLLSKSLDGGVNQIDLKDFAQGVYFLKWQNAKQNGYEKLLLAP